MFSWIWHTIFFDPIYNTLIYLIDILPTHDVGVAVICTVVIFKLIILPLSVKAMRTQHIMKRVQPELKELQEKYKNKREELGRHMLEVYTREGISPLAPLSMLLVQVPVLFALFFSIRSLPIINTELLYTFIPTPDTISLFFLGVVPMDTSHIGLALLAGITAYIQISFTLSHTTVKDNKQEVEVVKSTEPDLKQDFAESMQRTMKYGMPVMITFAGYSLSSVIALYFIVSNITTFMQEWFIHRKLDI